MIFAKINIPSKNNKELPENPSPQQSRARLPKSETSKQYYLIF
jgi:hypothetical protein